MLVKFTYVDSVTHIPVSIAPATNGPALPEGINFDFAAESEYPTEVPTFYGTTDLNELPDGATEITQAQYDEAKSIQDQFLAAREAEIEKQQDEIEAQRLAKEARQRRDVLLLLSDWVALKEYEQQEPMSDEWAAYHQALRDVPSQSGFPLNIEWPTSPEDVQPTNTN